MAFDLEEQEQIASLKQFWAEYGKLIITCVILALAAFGGVKGWRYYQATLAGEASAVFAKFEEGVRKNDVAEIRKLGAELVDKYGSTAYGPMAALVLAKSEYENGDAAAATQRLRWAIDKARDGDTAALARVRLAGIFLDEKKYDEALEVARCTAWRCCANSDRRYARRCLVCPRQDCRGQGRLQVGHRQEFAQ